MTARDLCTSIGLALGTVGGLVAVVLALSTPIGAVRIPTTTVDGRSGSAMSATAIDAKALSDSAASRNLFSPARRAAEAVFDPSGNLRPTPAESDPIRPMLQVSGIVEGAVPAAVIEGFPGVQGARAVRVGDIVAGLTVRRIADGQVQVVGMDTVWVLAVRKPWQ